MQDNSYQVGLLNALNSKLNKEGGMLRNILSVSENAYLYYDFSDKSSVALGNWEHFFGVERDQLTSVSMLADEVEDTYLEAYYETVNPEKDNNQKLETELELKKSLWAKMEVFVTYENDVPLFKVLKFSDITKAKQKNEELAYMAYYDTLTGLYNRNYFVLLLNEMVTKAQDNQAIVSLLFIDIDDFRKVNDGMGLLEGDEVVQSVGLILKGMMNDNVIASHFNSDIYCMAIYDPCGNRSVDTITKNIRESLKEPIKLIGGSDVILTVSIGIAEYPESSTNPLELINLAEIVMLKAKHCGKNNIQYYDKPIIEEFIGNIEIEKKLEKAMKEKDFRMFYQPQYDTVTKTLRGAEALVRWKDGEGSLVSPETFIPIAERNGSILMLGDWIIEETLGDFAKWSANHDMKNFLLSINVSSLQFKNKNFVKFLIGIITKYNINPKNIELEITESVFIDNMNDIIKKMKELREFGIRFSMDDFGTGFSSLSYLRDLPIDTLKIDKSFIDDVVTDISTRTIAESIIELSKKLGFDTIAEGVEEEVQYSLLRNMGCENIQGFYFGKPMTYEDMDKLLGEV